MNPALTVKELISQRIDLERKLQHIINSEVEEFNDRTGLGISSIDIQFADVTTLRHASPQFVISGAVVNVVLPDGYIVSRYR